LYRHTLLTGPAEDQSRQKHPVYNDPNGYPSGLNWQVDIGTLRVSTEEFFENLFFSVEKNGGNAFFIRRTTKIKLFVDSNGISLGETVRRKCDLE